MPFVLVVLLVSVLAGRLAGGRIGRLARIELRRTWLIFVAVALQLGVAMLAAAGGPAEALGWPLLAVSQLAVLAFIAANRQQPGMSLIFLGLALNAAVIVANGAMPVSGDALTALGGGTIEPGKHEPLTGTTLLPALADTIALPVLRSVVSPGDLLLAAGVGILVVSGMRRPTQRPARSARALSPLRRPEEEEEEEED